MNKRQYIFLGLLIILLYLSYTIIKYEYKKYSISVYNRTQNEIIDEIKTYLKEANRTIEYKKSKAYKNKILKEQQWLKMKGEKVIYLTQESTYDKFKTTDAFTKQVAESTVAEKSIVTTMTNFQKWIYFLFKRDLR